MYNDFYNFKLAQMVDSRERILWQSKPDKKCFVLESIFNPFAGFALLWFLFDAFMLFAFSSSSTIDMNGTPTPTNEAMKTIVPFFILHMMPVWIYLGGVLFTFSRYKNTEYIITDKAVYISGGTFSCNNERKEIEKLTNIGTRQGFFDTHLGVGDVILEKYTSGYGKNSHEVVVAINDIPDFQNVYSMLIDLRNNLQKSNQE